jgi:hypothetical protein
MSTGKELRPPQIPSEIPPENISIASKERDSMQYYRNRQGTLSGSRPSSVLSNAENCLVLERDNSAQLLEGEQAYQEMGKVVGTGTDTDIEPAIISKSESGSLSLGVNNTEAIGEVTRRSSGVLAESIFLDSEAGSTYFRDSGIDSSKIRVSDLGVLDTLGSYYGFERRSRFSDSGVNNFEESGMPSEAGTGYLGGKSDDGEMLPSLTFNPNKVLREEDQGFLASKRRKSFYTPFEAGTGYLDRNSVDSEILHSNPNQVLTQEIEALLSPKRNDFGTFPEEETSLSEDCNSVSDGILFSQQESRSLSPGVNNTGETVEETLRSESANTWGSSAFATNYSDVPIIEEEPAASSRYGMLGNFPRGFLKLSGKFGRLFSGKLSKEGKVPGPETNNRVDTIFDRVYRGKINNEQVEGVVDIKDLVYNVLFEKDKEKLEKIRLKLDSLNRQNDDQITRFFINQLEALIGKDNSCLENDVFRLVVEGLGRVKNSAINKEEGARFEERLIKEISKDDLAEKIRIMRLFQKVR